MIIYDILSILQHQVSTTVMDLVVVFALFVFTLALLLCFCVSTVFSVNEDFFYIKLGLNSAMAALWGISGKAAVRGQLFYIRLPHPSLYALWFKDGVKVTRYCSLRVGFSCANSTERWRRMG